MNARLFGVQTNLLPLSPVARELDRNTEIKRGRLLHKTDSINAGCIPDGQTDRCCVLCPCYVVDDNDIHKTHDQDFQLSKRTHNNPLEFPCSQKYSEQNPAYSIFRL